jgi:hypothetical protein
MGHTYRRDSAFSVSKSGIDSVYKYIADQEHHHKDSVAPTGLNHAYYANPRLTPWAKIISRLRRFVQIYQRQNALRQTNARCLS